MPKSSKQQLTKLQRQELKKRWTSEDGLTLLSFWARAGLKPNQIEERMGLPSGFITKLANSNKKVARALNEGRELINAKIEGKLIQKAMGYKKKKTIVGVDKITGRPFTEEVEEEVEPNFSAIAMWLNNNMPEVYKRGDIYVKEATIEAEQRVKEELATGNLPTEIRVISVSADDKTIKEKDVVEADYEVEEE